uniref:NADH-ubiquinone oxidoreductase chain 6 n=1 Tax=Centropyge loriculus TaxID=586789 RepID=A8E225_CENLO|nr:NADH dehydrogenase subunit 6 [Centropyge loriculus]BAF80413.1 NADH dehydrogenase subunit 6 [Centropyge loriculus]
MTYMMILFSVGLVSGLVAVASNPSPYFAALGLVVVSGFGCGLLAALGGSFLSMILFLIYLGGMLVVFAYSAALAAEPFPETWGHETVVAYIYMYFGVSYCLSILFGLVWSSLEMSVEEFNEFSEVRGDVGGVALMYSLGGGLLVVGAWVLLLTLFVVLELTRGLSRGTLRAV